MRTILAKCDYILEINNYKLKIINEVFPISYIPTIKLHFHERTIILN